MSEPKFKVGEHVRITFQFTGHKWQHLTGMVGVVVDAISPHTDVGSPIWSGKWNYHVDLGIVDEVHPNGIYKLMETSLVSAENGVYRARKAICDSK